MEFVHRGSEWHFKLVLDMLSGIRSLLSRNAREHQRALSEAGSFTYIVDLLNTEHQFDKAILCDQVLNTLRMLMSNNRKTKVLINL